MIYTLYVCMFSWWRMMHTKLHILWSAVRGEQTLLHSLKSSQFARCACSKINILLLQSPFKVASHPDVWNENERGGVTVLSLRTRECSLVCNSLARQFFNCSVRKFAYELANLEHFETLINCFRCGYAIVVMRCLSLFVLLQCNGKCLQWRRDNMNK